MKKKFFVPLLYTGVSFNNVSAIAVAELYKVPKKYMCFFL